MSKLKNGFQEINAEITLCGKSDARFLTYMMIGMAKVSTAVATTVRLRFLPPEANTSEHLDIGRFIQLMGRYTASNNGEVCTAWKRELIGVDGVLYRGKEKVWVWERIKPARIQVAIDAKERVEDAEERSNDSDGKLKYFCAKMCIPS